MKMPQDSQQPLQRLEPAIKFGGLTDQAKEVTLCSGFGQYHTNNPTTKAQRKPYSLTTLADVRAMLSNPAQIEKSKAQWVIFSSLANEYGRVAEKQREEGLFHALWADLDHVEGMAAIKVFSLSCGVIGHETWFYTSRSATEQNPKGRLIIPLLTPVTGKQFEVFQEVLNNKLAAAGIAPDPASQTANQVMYLPNRGEFYTHYFTQDGTPRLDPKAWQPEALAIHEARKKEAVEVKQRNEIAKEKLTALQGKQGFLPIEAVNSLYDCENLWQSYGAKRIGSKLLSPFSESGAAGISIVDGGNRWISNHGNDVALGIGKVSNGGGSCSGDAFDLITYFEFNNDRKAAVKEMAQELDAAGDKERKKAFAIAQANTLSPTKSKPQKLHRDAESLADKINAALGQLLDSDLAIANPEVVSNILNGAFWSGAKSKLYMLNEDQSLVQFLQTHAFNFLQQTHGYVVAKELLDQEITNFEESYTGEKELTAAAKETLLKRCNSVIAKVVMDYILLKRQRDATNWDVNMFNKTSLITLEEFSANVALTHKTIMPKVGLKVIDSQAVADYKEHFTRFDEMLQFIVAARFAKDRKQAYVWLHATSDWGKSFFKSLFDKMGLVVEMSVKEIEAAFESKPFAKSPRDFLNAFILVVEEFKSVKSEIKQLEREIRISPKNQPEATVPIYAKMFLSANTVGGLVGESGVEEQFANRFSYIKESGNLSERAMFKSIGKTDYHDSVTLYAAQEINKMVLRMVAMGEREATKFAENWISEFIGRYGIGKTFGRFENTLPELAADINHWLINTSNQSASANYNPSQSINNFVLYSNGQAFLLRGTKAVNEYIKLNYTPAEAGSLYPVIPELLLLLSSDGKGIIPRKINGKSEKAVSLKVSDISLIPR